MNVLPLQDYTFTKLYDKAFMSLIDKKWIEWFKYIQKYNNEFRSTKLLLTFLCSSKEGTHYTWQFWGTFQMHFQTSPIKSWIQFHSRTDIWNPFRMHLPLDVWHTFFDVLLQQYCLDENWFLTDLVLHSRLGSSHTDYKIVSSLLGSLMYFK